MNQIMQNIIHHSIKNKDDYLTKSPNEIKSSRKNYDSPNVSNSISNKIKKTKLIIKEENESKKTMNEDSDYIYLNNVSDYLNSKLNPELHNNFSKKSSHIQAKIKSTVVPKLNYNNHNNENNRVNIQSYKHHKKNSVDSTKLPKITNSYSAYEDIFNINNKARQSLKVESIFKTETRLRDTINNQLNRNINKINSKMSSLNLSKDFSINYTNIKPNDNSKQESYEKKIISELHEKILQSKNLKQTHALYTKEEWENIKINQPEGLMRSELFEINSMCSYPNIVHEKDIMCIIYDENVQNLKKFIERRNKEKNYK